MTQEDYKHPIAPPPELVQQWVSQCVNCTFDEVFQEIAQWGADQELEACCEWLNREGWSGEARQLRAARRPSTKPPIAAAQAKALIERHEDGWCPSDAEWHVIREGLAEGLRALEQLDD